jgi:hypothetical protein
MKAIFLEIFCMFGTMSASVFLYDEFLIDPTGYLIRVLGLSAPMLLFAQVMPLFNIINELLLLIMCAFAKLPEIK